MPEPEKCFPDYPARGALEQGAFVGPKPPLKPKQVWSIRLNLQRESRLRDLALFDLARK